MTRRGHAKARFVADPLHDAQLDRAFGSSVEIVIVHVHRVRAFVESDKCMDHRLAAEGDLDSRFSGRSKSSARASSSAVLARLGRFSRPSIGRPAVLAALGIRRTQIRRTLESRGWRCRGERCRPLHSRVAIWKTASDVSYAWPLPGDVPNSAGRGLPFISRQISSLIAVRGERCRSSSFRLRAPRRIRCRFRAAAASTLMLKTPS